MMRHVAILHGDMWQGHKATQVESWNPKRKKGRGLKKSQNGLSQGSRGVEKLRVLGAKEASSLRIWGAREPGAEELGV